MLATLPSKIQDVNSPDKSSDYAFDVIDGTLKVTIAPIRKPWMKVCQYQKGDDSSVRKGAFKFAKKKVLKWSFKLSLHNKIIVSLLHGLSRI